ncbi:hypothetical protein H4W30_005591 [Amycolatopsis roodepoortensis]|uniref:Uncharacterized protein n=1 Tax=Amycolatopsis roodepoortensis TaxID=700274 RepID=A0ABR9LEM1_9PSEU|nr:hypothetical protein [Amycolatopsis roodepoortensis]
MGFRPLVITRAVQPGQAQHPAEVRYRVGLVS